MSEKRSIYSSDESRNIEVSSRYEGSVINSSNRTPNRTMARGFDSAETVKVCLRIRPVVEHEKIKNCVKIVEKQSDNQCHLNINSGTREYRFTHVFENASQTDVFSFPVVSNLLKSVLEGYSATIFAYGQTGSGKTYTMQGYEEILNGRRELLGNLGGIMPRSFDYIFKLISQRQDKYQIKASYMEIYNEQIIDLLNPSSGVLQCRYHVKGGFYVNDLLVVDVLNLEDLIVILEEGQKNRKVGCHDLNSRSSRSHSILQMWITSETQAMEGHTIKRSGKISFVDLAGSERLKESHSEGIMVKETGNINRSLFVLGKVITALTEKHKDIKPNYRDSKLTMLLQDSLGGQSLALMFACVSPVDIYLDETLSTLNYASRVMNIKNKPVVQMGKKDQVITNLKREVELFKLENKYLKTQLNKISGGEFEIESSIRSFKQSQGLPPLDGDTNSQSIDFNDTSQMRMRQNTRSMMQSQQFSNNNNSDANQRNQQISDRQLNQYHSDINMLKNQNNQYRTKNEYLNKTMMEMIEENIKLVNRIENLENRFLKKDQGFDGDTFSMEHAYNKQQSGEGKLVSENKILQSRINKLQKELTYFQRKGEENISIEDAQQSKKSQEKHEKLMYELNSEKENLKLKIDELQRREKSLIQQLLKSQQQTQGQHQTRRM